MAHAAVPLWRMQWVLVLRPLATASHPDRESQSSRSKSRNRSFLARPTGLALAQIRVQYAGKSGLRSGIRLRHVRTPRRDWEFARTFVRHAVDP